MLATKVGDTESAAPWLTALVRADTAVVVAQNGIDHERRVAPLVGDATIVPALVYLAVERVEPEQLVWHSGRDIVLPSGPVAGSVASVFSGTNLRVRHDSDFRTAVWRKLFSNVGANPITTLTMRRMDVLAEPDIRGLATGLLSEAVAVARVDGATVDEDEVESIVRLWKTFDPSGGSSMLYDRIAGRGLEHEYLTGAVVRYGEHYGVDVPRNRAILALLRARDPAAR